MKIIFKFFVTIIIIFVACVTNHGICQTTEIQTTQSTSTQKIVEEISPLIDADTAIVCYVNLDTFKEIQRLSKIIERLAEIEQFNENIRRYFKSMTNIQNKNDNIPNKNSKANRIDFSILIEQDITRLYLILNMKDLKFGPYFVIPDVQENTHKATVIEKFFGIKNNNDDVFKHTPWIVYKKKCAIIGGSNPILSYFQIIYYRPLEQFASMIKPEIENATCGFNNLNYIDAKKYINDRFDNFKAIDNIKFQRGVKKLDDCNMIKLIFLFPDAIASLELLRLKKMDEPFNQTTFEFLKNIRDYCAFGIDTNQPKVKLIIQCKSPKDAMQFKEFLDGVCKQVVKNYFAYDKTKTKKNSLIEPNASNQITPSEWENFLIHLLPKPKNNMLETVIESNYMK
ncbi:MAG: hypothetical protein LBC74_04040 [Planctomycetaceae bacterium]|jgi:hypothetical protein|nr:hypothetical protein [Planctomycetaceae bacterium]